MAQHCKGVVLTCWLRHILSHLNRVFQPDAKDEKANKKPARGGFGGKRGK